VATKKTTKRTKPKNEAKRRRTAGRKASSRKRLVPSKESRGLEAAEIGLPLEATEVEPLSSEVRAAGGVPIGAYREPLAGRPLLLATLPRRAIAPTPFQRDLSPTHSKRLARKIEESAAFLDPLIVVRGQDGGFWTPNGRHRLAAAKILGLRQVTVLISPDESLAFRILALNTEKAHNLKDRSLEVIRMARELAERHRRAPESDYAAQFEAPEHLTLGILYEQESRFAGSAYSPLLKKVDRFSDRTLPASLRQREGWAARLLAVDTEVKRIVEELKDRGFRSPYLRNYVVARINPVRFHRAKRGDPTPPMSVGDALTRMSAAARTFDVASVRSQDLALVGALVSE